MPYPGSKHGLLRFQGTGPHAYASIVRFLDRTIGAGAACVAMANRSGAGRRSARQPSTPPRAD